MADSSNNNNNNNGTCVAGSMATTTTQLLKEQTTHDTNDNIMKQCYENLIVIDAGANLTNKKYSRDLDSVVQRAKDAGEFVLVLLCAMWHTSQSVPLCWAVIVFYTNHLAHQLSPILLSGAIATDTDQR